MGRKYNGVETDIWSLGVILYTILCGGMPFDDDDEQVMKGLIIKGEYETPEWLSPGKSIVDSWLLTDQRHNHSCRPFSKSTPARDSPSKPS